MANLVVMGASLAAASLGLYAVMEYNNEETVEPNKAAPENDDDGEELKRILVKLDIDLKMQALAEAVLAREKRARYAGLRCDGIAKNFRSADSVTDPIDITGLSFVDLGWEKSKKLPKDVKQ